MSILRLTVFRVGSRVGWALPINLVSIDDMEFTTKIRKLEIWIDGRCPSYILEQKQCRNIEECIYRVEPSFLPW